MEVQRSKADDRQTSIELHKDEELPQCKIKRNYSCNHCTYFTQNPRFHLTHLRDIHGERIVINKCNLCLYASRHYQKLVRHMKMVHGSTEGITGQSRKRASAEENACNQQQKKVPIPPLLPLLFPLETTTDFGNLSNDLELSRNSLKDIAALYFAENQIDKIMTQMEEADAVQLPALSHDATVATKRKVAGNSFFDELKKSFVNEGNLTCKCGHVSKCFSESFIHQKACSSTNKKRHEEVPIVSISSGSTRCQHCRRRCKSSVDLLNHLKTCIEYERNESLHSRADTSCENEKNVGGDADSDQNRVFVWNKVSDPSKSNVNHENVNEKCDPDEVKETQETAKSSVEETPEDNSYFGVETAPGYGEVTKKMSAEEEATSSSLKKVFKCPRCSFWASTASRFHVHIVGHLNKKPFKCSLCTYRSNWRWDITKHIRLKSIRNPCHKNARVLMNDETGRRNYTKYNKYITLMKVPDEDGDPKLIKSGEMTPHQVASLAFIHDTSESELMIDDSSQELQPKIKQEHDGGNSDADTTDHMGLSAGAPAIPNAYQIDQKQSQSQAGTKRTTPPLLRPSDDLITDIKTEGLEKKIFYKCRKCYFRHANRDAVLAHVKIHYQDSLLSLPSSSKPSLSTLSTQQLQAAVNSTSFYMNKVFAAAISLTQKQLLQEQKSQADRNNNQYSVLGGVTSSSSGLSQQDTSTKSTVDSPRADSSTGGESCEANKEKMASTSVTSTTTTQSLSNSSSASTTSSASSFIGGASKSAMLMGVIAGTNFGNDTNERRDPSPFRCGHCHQVSNWKHVIQRHCRLKHSGYIRIETFDRNSDGHAPMYRPLDFCGSGQQRHSLGSSADSYILEAMKAQNPHQPQPLSNTSTSAPSNSKSELLSQDSSVSSSNSEQDLLMNHLEITRIPLKPHTTSKQLKCPSCPYVSQNKVQLNFHMALHKPTQYKCNLCSYICAKKQHLSNHLKTHDPPTPPSADMKPKKSPDHEKPSTTTAIKVISYCPTCPETFVNGSKKLQLHIKSHGADLVFKCSACDFSAKQEAVLLTHSFVHTSTYRDKAEQMAQEGKEDPKYPAQKMVKITLPKTGATAWVVAESPKVVDGTPLNKEPNDDTSTPTTSNSVSESGVQEKCPYCPFQNDCHKSFQHHLQFHMRVSNRPEKYSCEHCDYTTNCEDNFTKHTQNHFDAVDSKKSVNFFTSYDNLELIVSDNDGKKKEEEKPTNRVVNFKSEPKPTECPEKFDKEVAPNVRRRRRSSALKSEKDPSTPPPPVSSHKTILVNPKTGQVIRRN